MTRTTQMTLAALAAVYLLTLTSCYELVPINAAGGGVYRLNRLTGSVAFCDRYTTARCLLLSEEAPRSKPEEPKPAETQP
jgi:hypothetical protein